MTITLSTWMLLLSLVPWLFPGASSTTLTIETPTGEPTIMVLTATEENKWSLRAAAGDTPALLDIAQLHRLDTGYDLVMLSPKGKAMASKTLDPAVQFERIDLKDPKGLKHIKTREGLVLAVRYGDGVVTFEEQQNLRYSLWSGPLPVSRFSKTKTLGLTRHEGDRAGWRYLPTLRLNIETDAALPLEGTVPGLIAFAFIQRVMRDGKLPANQIAETITEAADTELFTPIKSQLQGAKHLDLIGLRYLRSDELPDASSETKMNPRDVQVRLQSQPSKRRWSVTLREEQGGWFLMDVTADPTKVP